MKEAEAVLDRRTAGLWMGREERRASPRVLGSSGPEMVQWLRGRVRGSQREESGGIVILIITHLLTAPGRWGWGQNIHKDKDLPSKGSILRRRDRKYRMVFPGDGPLTPAGQKPWPTLPQGLEWSGAGSSSPMAMVSLPLPLEPDPLAPRWWTPALGEGRLRT